MTTRPPPLQLSPDQRRRLKAAIEAQTPDFDEAQGMLLHTVGPAYDYNTHLRNCVAHATRKSLWHANQLLDSNENAYLARAERVIGAVLDCQVTDPDSEYLGVWPHFAEEPIPTGPYVDLNWADFCGCALLHAWLYHRYRISPALVDRMEQAIRLAATSIRRRNVGPGYTNIAIMGTYVTLLAGERLGDSELLAYGVKRLQRFSEFTDRCGGFQEFNSPTYTLVALKELARVRLHVLDPSCQNTADRLHAIAWQEIADHFHPPSQQWGGPHSRTYHDLLEPDDRVFLTRWTGVKLHGAGDAGQGCPEEDAIDATCPEEFRERFRRLDMPRLHRRTLHTTERTFQTTCYHHPAFSLGTIGRSMLWNQSRPLLAYMGPKQQPTAFRVRVLLNGYDFTAATLFTHQVDGRVLGGISFDPGAGVKHPVFDRMVDGRVRVRDLRLRFAFSGNPPAEVRIPQDQREPCTWTLGGVAIRTAILGAAFETPGANLNWCLATQNDPKSTPADRDFLLWEGEETSFQLGAFPAWVAFALELTDEAGAPSDFRTAKIHHEADSLNVYVHWAGMQLEIPRVPPGLAQRKA